MNWEELDTEKDKSADDTQILVVFSRPVNASLPIDDIHRVR